jgi:hypothetical protein
MVNEKAPRKVAELISKVGAERPLKREDID